MTWFIALTLVAFTGQTLSVTAMPCQMMGGMVATSSHGMSEHDMAAMDHDMDSMEHDMDSMMPMDHSLMADDGPVLKDCCKLPGHCISSGCSVAGFAYQLQINFALLRTTTGDGYLRVVPSTPVSSPFKPPILC